MAVAGSALVAACARRAVEIVEALGKLPDEEMLAASELPGWSRLTLICHIRYGAQAVLAMTPAVLAGEPAAYYPGGRATQRPGTLVPADGEGPQDVVESFARAMGELVALWAPLQPREWERRVIEPADNVDLSPLTLYQLAVLRLTETDVHAVDFGVGLADWTRELAEAGLPFRVSRLQLRSVPVDAKGAWRLNTTEGESYGVAVADGRVSTDTRLGAATIAGSRRDLFALLMGRPFTGPVDGPVEAFQEMFPGP